MVVVMAVGVVGCAEKREEELPQIDPAELEATAPAPPTEIATLAGTPMVEVETPPPVVPPTTASQTYTMQPGDTLYSLARRYYGDGNLWTRIAEANRSKFRNVTTIPVGTVLTIPPR